MVVHENITHHPPQCNNCNQLLYQHEKPFLLFHVIMKTSALISPAEMQLMQKKY